MNHNSEVSIQVTKASGKKQPFSPEKLRASLKRSGAAEEVVNEVMKGLTPELYEGITTKKLYSKAHKLLRRFSKPEASRFHLKRAIMQLGPSGFPFEKFVAKLLAEEGYVTTTSVIMKGKCVKHEVDVQGRRGKEVLLAECKYHNRGGVAVDVKVPLYVQARFQDIGAAQNGSAEMRGYVVTNARFTADAVTYGNCAGLTLLSWDQPSGGALRDRIDATGLYPVTCLGTLTQNEKELLLENGYVLAREVAQDDKKVAQLLGEIKWQKVKEEAGRVCACVIDAQP